MDEQHATGAFSVVMTPTDPALDGTARWDLTKVFTGDFRGHGKGVMVSAGDPAAGNAGYVVLETVRGVLGSREGGFAFVQLGLMTDGVPELTYRIVPGSGDGGLVGITGRLELSMSADGGHRYDVTYSMP